MPGTSRSNVWARRGTLVRAGGRAGGTPGVGSSRGGLVLGRFLLGVPLLPWSGGGKVPMPLSKVRVKEPQAVKCEVGTGSARLSSEGSSSRFPGSLLSFPEGFPQPCSGPTRPFRGPQAGQGFLGSEDTGWKSPYSGLGSRQLLGGSSLPSTLGVTKEVAEGGEYSEDHTSLYGLDLI